MKMRLVGKQVARALAHGRQCLSRQFAVRRATRDPSCDPAHVAIGLAAKELARVVGDPQPLKR